MSSLIWRRLRPTVLGTLATSLTMAGVGLVVAAPASAADPSVTLTRTCGPLTTGNQPGRQQIDVSAASVGSLPTGTYTWTSTAGGGDYRSADLTVGVDGVLPASATLTAHHESTLSLAATAFPLVLTQSGGATSISVNATVPAVTCAASPTVSVTKASLNTDKTKLTVWLSASGLAADSTFDITADEVGGDGTYAVTDATLTSKVELTASPVADGATPTFTISGRTHGGTDATLQGFGPSSIAVTADGTVTLASPVATWVACGTSLSVTYTMSSYVQGHKYQASVAVTGAGTVAGPTPPTAGTTGADPLTVTTTFASATTLPTTAGTLTLSVKDLSVDPNTTATLAGVTLPACTGVSASLPAGGTLSSDVANAVPTTANPLIVGVTTPVAGTVSITKTATSPALAGWTALGMHADISAPNASVSAPLKLTFTAHSPKLPAGTYPSDVAVFRNDVKVADCFGASSATPDPCVSARSWTGTTMSFTVLTSKASAWDLRVAHVNRLAGADRYGTALAISAAQFADKGASAVVLATGADYPDALVGAPLAAAKNAPLLLTKGSTLPTALKAEIVRALPAGATVYLIGGGGVIPASVQTQLTTLGYTVTRVSGNDRYSTATAVARALGSPSTVLLATGVNFPDALSAGVAAAKVNGAVLLTKNGTMPDTTLGYLNAHPGTTYAVGGPAAQAFPAATALVGANRYTTSTMVAGRFFTNPTSVGFAVGADFPDALSGGAMLARAGSPLVLTAFAGPTAEVTGYLATVKTTVTSAHLFGGTGVISNSAQGAITTALGL